jgi:hypothetical protein
MYGAVGAVRETILCSRLHALGRSVIADRPPSDGSDEEAEKRGLVHGGIHPPIGYLAVQQHVLLQLNLPGSEIERKPPFDSR